MELDWTKERATLDKELNSLDGFVIDFCAALDAENTRYVICSGYVAILFGRNRSSEDVGMFIERLEPERFGELWNTLSKVFECINASNPKEALETLNEGIALRFARNGEVIPNMEVKFPKNALDEWTIHERREVLLNNNRIFISPPEMQIAFKLSLGSEKDIEDARYLHGLLGQFMDSEIFGKMCRKLNVEMERERYL